MFLNLSTSYRTALTELPDWCWSITPKQKTQGPRISPLLSKNSEHFIGRNTYYPLGLKKEYVQFIYDSSM